MSGKNDVNAVRELFAAQAPTEQPVATEESADAQEDAAVEQVADLLIDSAEPIEQETEESEPVSEEAVSEEAEPADSYTVTSLGEAIGFEPSQMYDVEVPMGDGVEPVRLGDIKDKYQEASKERARLAAENTALKETAGKASQHAQEVDQGVVDAKAALKSVVDQYQSINWPEMEQQDPGKAALLRQQYQMAAANAGENVNRAIYAAEMGQREAMGVLRAEMIEHHPAWSDPAVMDADHGKVRRLMEGAGCKSETVNRIRDPQLIELMLELDGLRGEKGAATEAMKVVRKAPKRIRATGTPTSQKKGVTVQGLKKGIRGAPVGGKKQAETDAVRMLLARGLAE